MQILWQYPSSIKQYFSDIFVPTVYNLIIIHVIKGVTDNLQLGSCWINSTRYIRVTYSILYRLPFIHLKK